MTQAMSLGTRVRRYRLLAGVKQATLAKKSGLSRSLIASIEAGHRGKRPSYNTVLKLASALGLTVAQFAEDEGLSRT
jgi:transcriptional regulator with XRE-family HTH domain